MLVLAFPNLELLAVGVAACVLLAACGLPLPKQSWVLYSERWLYWAPTELTVCHPWRLQGRHSPHWPATAAQILRHTGLRIDSVSRPATLG